jgi:hypothetical protein
MTTAHTYKFGKLLIASYFSLPPDIYIAFPPSRAMPVISIWPDHLSCCCCTWRVENMPEEFANLHRVASEVRVGDPIRIVPELVDWMLTHIEEVPRPFKTEFLDYLL